MSNKKIYVKQGIIFPEEIIKIIPNQVALFNGRYSVSNYGRFFDNWKYQAEVFPYYLKDQDMTLYIDLDIYINNKPTKKAFVANLLVGIMFGPINWYSSRNMIPLDGNPFNISANNLNWANDPIMGNQTKPSLLAKKSNTREPIYHVDNIFRGDEYKITFAYQTMFDHPLMKPVDILKWLRLYPDEKAEGYAAILKSRSRELGRIRRKESPYTRYLTGFPDIEPRNFVN